MPSSYSSRRYQYGGDDSSEEKYYHHSSQKAMVTDARSSYRHRPSSTRSAHRSSKYGTERSSRGRESTSRYLENAVAAIEEFGEVSAMKLYNFKDKRRAPEKLKRNVVIKIEVSFEKYKKNEKASFIIVLKIHLIYLIFSYDRHPLYQLLMFYYDEIYGIKKLNIHAKWDAILLEELSMLAVK
jgi:hypothetical protein